MLKSYCFAYPSRLNTGVGEVLGCVGGSGRIAFTIICKSRGSRRNAASVVSSMVSSNIASGGCCCELDPSSCMMTNTVGCRPLLRRQRPGMERSCLGSWGASRLRPLTQRNSRCYVLAGSIVYRIDNSKHHFEETADGGHSQGAKTQRLTLPI